MAVMFPPVIPPNVSEVRDEAISQLALRIAQLNIDTALLQARLARCKELTTTVLDAMTWDHGDDDSPDGRGMTATIPRDMVALLQSVVTAV